MSDETPIAMCCGAPIKRDSRPPKDDKCPLCGCEVAYGYGLMGGGIGTYWACLSEDGCDYFYKEMDPEYEPHPTERGDGSGG